MEGGCHHGFPQCAQVSCTRSCFSHHSVLSFNLCPSPLKPDTINWDSFKSHLPTSSALCSPPGHSCPGRCVSNMLCMNETEIRHSDSQLNILLEKAVVLPPLGATVPRKSVGVIAVLCCCVSSSHGCPMWPAASRSGTEPILTCVSSHSCCSGMFVGFVIDLGESTVALTKGSIRRRLAQCSEKSWCVLGGRGGLEQGLRRGDKPYRCCHSGRRARVPDTAPGGRRLLRRCCVWAPRPASGLCVSVTENDFMQTACAAVTSPELPGVSLSL